MDEGSAPFWGSSSHLLRRDLNWYLFADPSPPKDSLKMGRAMDKYPLERDASPLALFKSKSKGCFCGR